MDEATKVEKKGMSEQTRQMLNKSIDLLHKVSNRKIGAETAKKELLDILSHYFLHPFKSGSDKHKGRFKALLDEVNEIVDKIESGRAPLYEAIMQVNKAVMHLPQNFIEEKEGITMKESHTCPIVKEKQIRVEEKSKGKFGEIQDQITRILTLKESLQVSVNEINTLLSPVGFELVAK